MPLMITFVLFLFAVSIYAAYQVGRIKGFKSGFKTGVKQGQPRAK